MPRGKFTPARKIDGHIMSLVDDYYTKSLAQKEANRRRRKGYLVRVIPRKAYKRERRFSNTVHELWQGHGDERKRKLSKSKRRK